MVVPLSIIPEHTDRSGPREWNTQDRQTETFIVPNYSRFLADTSILAASLSANGFVECTLMSDGCSPIQCVLLLPTRHKFISEALLCFCCAHSEPGEEQNAVNITWQGLLRWTRTSPS